MSLITKSTYLRGPKGDIGLAGPRGERGIAGAQGLQGPAGQPDIQFIRNQISATGNITYNQATGVIGFTNPGYATTTYVDTAIANLVSGAPDLLNTLNELAAAIGNNADFINSVIVKTGGTMTGALILNADPITNLGAATKQYVDAATLGITVNDSDDVPEGNDNLYYTTARTNTDFDTRLATKTTSNVTEGANLYYTDARTRNAISVTGSGSYNASTGVITVTGGVTSVNTKVGDVTLNTSDVSEGTNQYYTDTRARTAISATGNLNYNSGTGVMSYTEPGRTIDDLTDVDTSSSAPQDGESLIWDSGSNNWRPGQAAVNILTYNYDATAGQLIFTGQGQNQQALSYTDYDLVQVFKNGVLLRRNIQYTLNDSGYVDYEAMGDSIELTSPASLDDWIYIIVTNTTGSNPDFTTDGGAYADVMEPGLDGGPY
jgi:hypothetical protein